MASVERGANNLQALRCDPTADLKDHTLFGRTPVDSAGHWLASPAAQLTSHGKRDAIRKWLEKGEMQLLAGPANLADLANVVNLEKLVTLAEFELRLIDPQGLDAMGKRGWGNAKPRGGS